MIIKIPIEILVIEGNGCHLFVDCMINKTISCSLIIDTGASKTVFDYNLLNLISEKIEKSEEIKSAGVGGEITMSEFANISNFKIGELEIENLETVLIDLSNVNEIYEPIIKKKIWGLIGGDFLLKYKSKIDYKTKILTIRIRKNAKK